MPKCVRVVEGSKPMHNYHISCTIDSALVKSLTQITIKTL
jgi:hypothetical protein